LNYEIYDAFMLDHAVGALNAGLRVAADLHVRLSDEGADKALFWDVVGGALLERDSSSLSAVKPPRRRRKPVLRASADTILNTDLDRLKWKSGLSGACHARTGLPHSHFMRLEPGKTVPAHSHSAMEATVVLQGALDVDGEIFNVGEIALGAPGETHKPAAAGNTQCVCFVARGERPFWRLT